MRRSRLAAGGRNIFQMVREKRAEVAEKGVRLLDFSIGEPRGSALPSARKAAAEAVLSDNESMHSYQYNASPAVPDFSRRFIEAHIGRSLPAGDVAWLPIPGIKPTLGLLPLACGCAEHSLSVATMTRPGYPSPADWCGLLSGTRHYSLPLNPANEFRFSLADIEPGTELLMLNYPHNPSGQVAHESWLREICEYCAKNDIRLFNDAAYCVLAYDKQSITLSEVATDYPELSWAEAFTAAKLIGNGAGWHVGAMVGSPDFITDLGIIKGKTDTGFVAPMAAGALAALENDQAGIDHYRQMYERRVGVFIDVLTRQGMRLALRPRAGFFTLWLAPDRAFGEPMTDSAQFNFQMIERTGVVGVHFPGYLRYAVCADVEAESEAIEAAFSKARVEYD
ncbi:MAG: aminotransferase class I/II-fold pyridoxal phosphate-dependent enzyme [Gammaproteobacteria bacterium]|nr:aminotransferase class I/II-fold pyridoxal phosphate-dependent enzyme [Gammaproteobacteria bacterium]